MTFSCDVSPHLGSKSVSSGMKAGFAIGFVTSGGVISAMVKVPLCVVAGIVISSGLASFSSLMVRFRVQEFPPLPTAFKVTFASLTLP